MWDVSVGYKVTYVSGLTGKHCTGTSIMNVERSYDKWFDAYGALCALYKNITGHMIRNEYPDLPQPMENKPFYVTSDFVPSDAPEGCIGMVFDITKREEA